MPETEEDNRSFNNLSCGPPPTGDSPVMMTMDLDLDGSWTFDQIFSSDPAPSFILSASDQPFSPLWAFSDDNSNNNFHDGDNKTTGNANSTPPGATLRLLSNTGDEISKKDEKRRLPLPFFGVNPSTCVIKERMTLALRYLKESSEKHILAQVWAPVKNGSRYVLTTSGQPFVLDPNCSGLHQYRMASLMYMFSIDGESTGDGVMGLPGRVFRQKLPEWTPNVQYYSDKEYPRLNHALSHNVRGTLALPVFEPSRQSCVGVLELILTSQKINYAPEVDKVCKALEAVNLKSSDILDHPNTQICNESRQNALAEILEILTVVCETHNFPLAQTWVPCRHRSVLAYGGGFKKSCSSFDGSCMGQVCMSTTDVAFYVVDAHMWGFREACAEHHLQKGQGVAGRAFATRSSCFCENITRFCKTEYPLVHYARMFGLVGSFAICLRSSYTGDDDYVLEFFLPPEMVDRNEQQMMLGSLLTSMKQHFRSLKVASGQVIGDDGGSVEIIEADRLDLLKISESGISNGGPVARVDSFDPDGGGQMVKKSERKRGKAEKSISLEVLQQYFAGSLKDAAKSLGVCPTTMKRICRQHGISRWPSRKINKVNRSLTKLKRVIESVQGGAEGTFTIPSLPHSTSWPTTAPKNDPGPAHQTSGSREASTGSQTSHGSPHLEIESSPHVKVKIVESQPVIVNKQNLGVGLIEDAGSSHDLTNLYQVTECEKVQETAAMVQQSTARVVTIKASYREDIIRFRVGASSGIVTLKEEVSKRLKLEMGTFDIKYLDDDHEWVLIACDADLQECVELSRSTGCNNNNNNGNIVRLLVHDLSTKLGSSCESSD